MEIQTNIEVKKQVWTNHLNGEKYEDEIDILYYKNQLKDEKYQNELLGNFNSDAAYSIDKELLQELINVNKYIIDNVDGVYYLVAKTLDMEFKFLLKFKTDEKAGKKIATLTLIEGFTSADENIFQEFHTVIARYCDENDMYFMQKVAKVFHIFDKRDEDGKEKENEEILKNVLKLKKQLKKLKINIVETNEYLSKYYLDSVIAAFKKYSCPFSDYMLRQYAILLDQQKGNINKKNYYKILRIELDKLIEASKKLCDDPDLLKALETQKQIFANNFNKFEDNLMNPQIMAVPKKEEAKSASSAKSSSSSPAKKAAAKAKNAGAKKADNNQKSTGINKPWENIYGKKSETTHYIPKLDNQHQNTENMQTTNVDLQKTSEMAKKIREEGMMLQQTLENAKGISYDENPKNLNGEAQQTQ